MLFYFKIKDKGVKTMKILILITSTILLMTGCSMTGANLTPETNQLFDQQDWQPVNKDNNIKEELFYDKQG